jgi:hypothetical protein
MWLASAAAGASKREPKIAPPMRLSAPAMPPGFRVNWTA